MLAPAAGIPFVIINSLCGCLCAYGLAGLRLSAHAVLLNLCITALQSMISIQLQVRLPRLLLFAPYEYPTTHDSILVLFKFHMWSSKHA